MAVAVLILGLGFGVAFGAGYAAGSPRVVAGGLTQQQLATLVGAQALQSASATGAGSGAQGGTAQAGQGAQGGQSAAAGQAGVAAALQSILRNPGGRVTAVQGNTVTVETRTGSLKLNLSPSTSVTKVSTGAQGDLKVGDTIIASGTTKSDGSFDANTISQVPPELQAILLAGGAGGR